MTDIEKSFVVRNIFTLQLDNHERFKIRCSLSEFCEIFSGEVEESIGVVFGRVSKTLPIDS